jgi:hypothetical protein
MKSLLSLILCVAILPSVSFASDPFAVCGRIIDQGLRNYDISTFDEATLNTVFDNYCSSDGSRKSTNVGLGIDLVVKTIPVSFKGTFASDDEQMNQFCRNYASTYQRTISSRTYKNTIVVKGYEAFNQCIRFSAQGVSVEHNIISPATTSFFFTAGIGHPIEIRGVAVSSGTVICSGQVPQQKTGSNNAVGVIQYRPQTRVSTTETLGMVCQRTPELQADKTSLFREATVSITTNVGNYDVFFPKDVKLPDDSASAIAISIAEIQKSLDRMNDRVSNIKLKVGDQTTLPEFGCGQESIATESATFMVGVRDGTGCGVTNRNYVRALSLYVPPVK